ncbi:MFS transporter [Cupriavidus alkaliphilus]|uniref:MFS transporter n=1 Tax=Cupriavidus alkaliphilus TaxID=942866 RepID=UPI0016202567|nr:MFS transporter [Cupriavidus alkaliphilus]MBB2919641.1 AAHS family 4-hydroxybenzoate transporter-like MFS transporter [Cupriavidus alkaliphilus]
MVSLQQDIGATQTDAPPSAPDGAQRLPWRVYVLCGLVAFLDGFDTQSVGPAADAMAASIGIGIQDFGFLFSASQVGFLIGAVTFSALGDRFGRKRLLVAGTLLIALSSLGTALAGSYGQLLAIRILAGIGLGGVAPNFISLASEFTPPALRARVVTLLWAAVPIGGMVGSFASAFTLPRFGWQAIFLLGGGAPLLLVPLLAYLLPESREVQRHPHGKAGRAPGVAPLRTLFGEGRGMATAWLWLACWMTWTVLVVVGVWTPSLLRQAGWTIAMAASMLGLLNAGGVAGTVLISAALRYVSPQRALILALMAAAISIVCLGAFAQHFAVVAIAACLAGLFSSAAGGSLLALAASLYPERVRATGVGWSLGAARIGAVLGPVSVGWLVGWQWSTASIYAAIALPGFLAAASVFLLSRTATFRAAIR